jgi:hypothetical protein
MEMKLRTPVVLIALAVLRQVALEVPVSVTPVTLTATMILGLAAHASVQLEIITVLEEAALHAISYVMVSVKLHNAPMIPTVLQHPAAATGFATAQKPAEPVRTTADPASEL